MDLASAEGNASGDTVGAKTEVTAPRKRSHDKYHQVHHDCPNCHMKLVGDHCHNCGQHSHIHRTFLHMIEEAFHGIIHFESRTWRSLPMLAFRPGTLTRNYVMGQRTRYFQPFAMFLFSVFTMFFVFAFTGGPNLVSKEAKNKADQVQVARERVAETEQYLDEIQSDTADAEKILADLTAAGNTAPGAVGTAEGAVSGARSQLENAKLQVDAARAALDQVNAKAESKSSSTYKAELSLDTAKPSNAVIADISSEKAKAKKEGDVVTTGVLGAVETAAKTAPVAAEVTTATNPTEIVAMLKDSMRRGDFIVTPWASLNEKIKYKTSNPDLFLYKLQNTAYKFSFLFIPISLPFIWLMLFWKKDATLYDHTVFALYSLSFVSCLFMLISLSAQWVSAGWAFAAAALIMPVHVFFQFKGAYELSWFSALWRTVLFCSIFSWVIVFLFLLSIIALGVTG